MALFIAQATGHDAPALERAKIVQDGFSKPAFLFGPLWLLYSRLWAPLLVWIVVEGSYFAYVAPHVTPTTSVIIDLLAHLYLGFEGNRLRLRRNAKVTDIVEARDRDEAETIFFHRHLAESTSL